MSWTLIITTFLSYKRVDKLSDRCYTVNTMKLHILAKHTALILTLAGALATALAQDPLNIVLLNVGSILYLYWSATVRDWNLVMVNAGLLLIYLIGAVLRIG